jgi:hypothetical protein
MMYKDLIAIKKRYEVFILAWEMLIQSQMGEETGRIL